MVGLGCGATTGALCSLEVGLPGALGPAGPGCMGLLEARRSSTLQPKTELLRVGDAKEPLWEGRERR
jgi:hypothetical protein